MSDVLETKLKIESWDEKPYREPSDGTKLTRAQVALTGSADGLESGSFDSLMFYRADGSGVYVTLMHLTGTPSELVAQAGTLTARHLRDYVA